jgi:hypothetical protein
MCIHTHVFAEVDIDIFSLCYLKMLVSELTNRGRDLRTLRLRYTYPKKNSVVERVEKVATNTSHIA